ncbi:MAG TPA: rod shape-determining protein MreD [Verrucomicrobiae bacterium]|nr:rod shape-determining protein MreD [Verrucomicrobiae bacterium]
MNDSPPRAFIALSLLAAMVLQLFELPYALGLLRPLWVPLVLVYWAMAIPRPFGLLTAWFTGLCLDVLVGSVLGQHALGLTIIVFLAIGLRGWLALFPIWQEAALLGALWLLYTFLMFWIDGATGHQADTWLQWTPVVTTGLCWPLLVGLMNSLRRRTAHDPLHL